VPWPSGAVGCVQQCLSRERHLVDVTGRTLPVETERSTLERESYGLLSVSAGAPATSL